MPIDQITLESTTPIFFRHPDIKKDLKIGTGVSGISWSYNLNTLPSATYGGQVVQVLSAYVDALTVHGQTTDNRQLRQIADWFLEYMQLAGLHNRDEHFITMEYPERGWSFWLQITALPDFHYDINELAIEWSITAEIVADNDLNYLSQHTMSGYTEVAFDASMWDMKFMAHDPRNDPIHLDPSLGLKIGDNFQSLLGAWATGDFAHWAFDATASTSANHLKTAREYWTQIYGSDTPFAMAGRGGGAGGAVNLTNPVGSNEIAAAINAEAEAAGIPGYIMVASAIDESGLNPDRRQTGGDSAMGLFQSFPRGAAGSGPHRTEVQLAFDHPGDPVTKYWSAIHQIQDAVGWWKPHLPVTGDPGAWAKRAQGAGDPAYASKIDALIPRAKALIALTNTTPSPSGGTFGALISKTATYAGPDQGIDFTGPGTVFAVADGTISRAQSSGSGWPGSGGMIVLRMSAPIHRPAIGITATHVYHAEDIVPLLRVGQVVSRGTAIARATGSGRAPGIECGWGQGDSGIAYGSVSDGKPGGPTPRYGIDFGNFVKALS